jgi:hypothetical protein
VTAPADVLAGVLALVREAAREGTAEALAAHVAQSPAASAQRLTLDDLAHAESTSRATIRRLVRDGAPVHYLGASPRFDIAEWRAWCAERGRRATQAKPSMAAIAGVRLLSRRGSR